MKTTAEMKIEVSNARIRNENVNDECILVEASRLSLTDTFMSYEPKTEAGKEFKDALTKVIETGIEDFYRPTMDPSFADEEKTKIHYMAGEKPAVGKSYSWWNATVKDSKWCFGTKAQYVAFLGVLIKMLVAKGWTCCEAWYAVCNDSKKLGHYYDSDNAKRQFENTGSREICGFFDLANTSKILAEDEEEFGFWFAAGNHYNDGHQHPLANVRLLYHHSNVSSSSVAWLVLKK